MPAPSRGTSIGRPATLSGVMQPATEHVPMILPGLTETYRKKTQNFMDRRPPGRMLNQRGPLRWREFAFAVEKCAQPRLCRAGRTNFTKRADECLSCDRASRRRKCGLARQGITLRDQSRGVGNLSFRILPLNARSAGNSYPDLLIAGDFHAHALSAGLYVDRAPGGDRDHRRPDRSLVARGASRSRSGSPRPMHE